MNNRKILLKDSTLLTFKRPWTGFKSYKIKNYHLKKIDKKSNHPQKKHNYFLNWLIIFNALKFLEIGTSLGITTAYLSNANKKASITTIEGDPNI